MNNRTALLAILAIVIVNQRLLALNPTTQRSPSAMILQRMANIHTLKVKYFRKVTYNQKWLKDASKDPTINGEIYTNTFNGEFIYSEGDIRLEETPTPETEAYFKSQTIPDVVHTIEVHSKLGRCESLMEQSESNGKHIFMPGITQSDDYSPLWRIDLALGLRLYGHTLMSAEALQSHLSSEVSQGELVTATYLPEKNPGLTHTQTFDLSKGGAMVSYITESTGNNIRILNSDFRNVGGVLLPYKIDAKIPMNSGQANELIDAEANEITVSEYEVNPKLTETDISILWPAHVHVFDGRVSDRVAVGDKARILTDEDIRSALKAQAKDPTILHPLPNRD